MTGSPLGISYTGVNTVPCAAPSYSLAFRGVETGEGAHFSHSEILHYREGSDVLICRWQSVSLDFLPSKYFLAISRRGASTKLGSESLANVS